MKGATLLKSTDRVGGEGMTFVEALDGEKEKKQPQAFNFFPVSDDFQSMRSPLLEMFNLKRIVIDEFPCLQDFDYCVSKAIEKDMSSSMFPVVTLARIRNHLQSPVLAFTREKARFDALLCSRGRGDGGGGVILGVIRQD